MQPSSLFSLWAHLKWLNRDGHPLEVLADTVDFERFQPLLVKRLQYSDGTKGGGLIVPD